MGWAYFATHPVRPRVNMATMSMIFINDNDFIAFYSTKRAKKFPEENTGKGQDSVNFTPGKTCP